MSRLEGIQYTILSNNITVYCTCYIKLYKLSTAFFVMSLGEATMRRSFSAILLCVVQFKCAIFHYMWTNGETQTNEQSIYLDIYLQCDQMLK